MDPLGLATFYPGNKFGAKSLIEAKIMAQNRNPRWRPSAIYYYYYYYYYYSLLLLPAGCSHSFHVPSS